MGKFTAAAIVLVALITGCSADGPGAGKTPATTPSAQPSTTTPTGVGTTAGTPSLPATPTVLTREQAAQRYMAIIKPSNDVLAEPRCMAAESFFVDGGSWPPNEHPEYGEHADQTLRGCHKRIVPLYVAEISAFQTTNWPVDAHQDMADLISQDQALLYCFRKTSKATSMTAMYKALECFPEDDGSADRVRARFGLPGRSQS